MIGIVVVTHAQLGEILIKTTETIFQDRVRGVTHVSIDLRQPATRLRKDIKTAINQVDRGAGVLLLTDMFGGTPSNLSYTFLEEGRIEVLAGVNLPVLIRAIEKREDFNLKDLSEQLEKYGKKSICLASCILKGNKKAEQEA